MGSDPAGDDGERPEDPRDAAPAGGPRRDGPGGERTRYVRVAETGYLVEIRRAEGELRAVADVPGASVDDLTVGIDRNRHALVIRHDDTTLDRIDLPWESAEATKTWFNNGVLEVRLRPAGA